MRQRRFVMRCVAAIAIAAACTSAGAQAYPAKPIQLYVAFGPGGVGDIVARLVAREMSKNMGQAVIVENRPVPIVGTAVVAKAKPDGYSLALTGNGTALTTALFKSLPYDLMQDLTHVSTLAFFDMTLIAGSASQFNAVADVLAYAKANPGKLNIGTARLGSTQNLAAEMFKAMAGIDAVVVPYKSTADLVTAVRTNDVHVAFEILPPILSQITSKTVKALAVTSSKRFSGLPEVPTVAESGIPGFEATSWSGISVPAKTPAAIVDRLGKEVQAAVASPEVQKALQAVGIVASSSSPEQMSQRMKSDIAKWRAVIDKAGIPRQ